ncbi:MAG: O-antigen ligase family protein, partial [Victivallales bacterium]|nr:O-antigen ligase family protein [Victivallales bacterium]
HRPPMNWRDGALLVPLVAFAPVLCGLSGLVHTTEWAYATKWLLHFYTIACFSFGLWWASRKDAKLLQWAFTSLAIGAFFSAFDGWQQHFGGLERELQMQLENARDTGQELSEQMLLKFQQTRSYGHFSDPNIYAAQLLLTCPLLLVLLDRTGRRCSSPKLARSLLTGAGAVLFLGALIFSGSRGAFIGLAGGLAVFCWVRWGKRLSRKGAILLTTLVILGALAGGVAISVLSQRKLETASVRLEYYHTASRIFARFPVFGAGLGEFFPWHIRLKGWQLDEARDPHSLFFAQLSQCGLFGLLDALLRLGLPLLLALGLLRKHRNGDSTQVAAVLAAWSAWNIHALLQFNDLVISTATIAGAIGLFALDTPANTSSGTQPASATRRNLRLLPSALLLLLALGAIWPLHRMATERKLQQISDHTMSRDVPSSILYDELKDGMAQAPDEVYLAKRLTDIAMHNQDYSIAQEASDELIRRAPHRSTSWLRRWQLLTLTDAPESDRQAALENAILWYPTSPNLWFQVAIAKLNLSRELFLQFLFTDAHFDHRDGNGVIIAYKLPKLPAAWHLDDLQNRLNQLALTTPDGFQLKFQEER